MGNISCPIRAIENKTKHNEEVFKAFDLGALVQDALEPSKDRLSICHI